LRIGYKARDTACRYLRRTWRGASNNQQADCSSTEDKPPKIAHNFLPSSEITKVILPAEDYNARKHHAVVDSGQG
jgi:hypothetical protein